MQGGLTNNELNPVRLPVRAIALKWIDRYASDLQIELFSLRLFSVKTRTLSIYTF